MSISSANTIAGHDGSAVKVTGPSGLHFLSGINPNPVYHGQPMSSSESALPSSIRDQTELMLANLTQVLPTIPTTPTGPTEIACTMKPNAALALFRK